MSKFLGGLACAAVGTGTSVGGAYLMGAFDFMDATLPKTLDDFKTGQVGDCVKNYFPGFDVTKVTVANNVSSSNLDFSTGEGNVVSKSCLVVNWERENYSTDADNWKGSFRWLGSFVKGNKGFVMFNVGSNSTAKDKELDLKGAIYVLEKDNSSTGTAKNNADASTSKKNVTKDEFDNTFPKAADPMKSKFSSKDKQEGGGFVKGKDEIDKLCKDTSDGTSTCKTSSGKESFKGLWTWESSETEGTDGSLTSWSSNMDKGVPNLYSGANELKSKLSSFKGKGNKPVVFEESLGTERKPS